MESLEDLAKTLIPESKSGDQLINKVLEDMPNLLQEQNSSRAAKFDDRTSQAIEKLLKERIQGRYQNDREGFTQALLEVSKHATYDETRTAASLSLFNPTLKVDTKSVLQELEQDRERMTIEIMH